MTKKAYILTKYAIQCRDIISGDVGCFFFDLGHWQQTGEFKAVGKVFPDLYAFYKNTKPEERKPLYLERVE